MENRIKDMMKTPKYLEIFNELATKGRGRPRSSEDEKISLVMYCNPEMRQYLVEVKSQSHYIRSYYANLRKNIIYFKKLIDEFARKGLTTRHELQQCSPEIPRSFSGKSVRSFSIDKGWYDDIGDISSYVNTSNSNMGLILSYLSLPISFYEHYPRLMCLYENIENIMNKYYIVGDVKLHKIDMIRDAHHNIYDNASDIRKLAHGVVEIWNKISSDESKSEDEKFRDDVNVIISLINVENITQEQVDYLESLINRYWGLLVENDYTKDLRYW